MTPANLHPVKGGKSRSAAALADKVEPKRSSRACIARRRVFVANSARLFSPPRPAIRAQGSRRPRRAPKRPLFPPVRARLSIQ